MPADCTHVYAAKIEVHLQHRILAGESKECSEKNPKRNLRVTVIPNGCYLPTVLQHVVLEHSSPS